MFNLIAYQGKVATCMNSENVREFEKEENEP